MKFLTLNDQIGEILKELGDKIDTEEDKPFTAASIGDILCGAGEVVEKRVTEIIRQSIDEPELTTEQILDWDPEDFLGVLAKILEQNLTPMLKKKATGVFTVIQQSLPTPTA